MVENLTEIDLKCQKKNGRILKQVETIPVLVAVAKKWIDFLGIR